MTVSGIEGRLKFMACRIACRLRGWHAMMLWLQRELQILGLCSQNLLPAHGAFAFPVLAAGCM